jgi:sugar-specific transcriptional regulator TrmB
METELKEYGLSEKEAKIYIANLKSGDCTANKLSELTGIRRSTVYEVIETMKKKGIISSYKKDKRFYFSPLPPTKLITLLREKEEKIKRIVPELSSLIGKTSEKPNVQLYEGINGMKNVVEEMLISSEILVYGATKSGDQIFEHYIPNFAKRREEKKVKMRAIISPDLPKHMVEKGVSKYTKIRTLEIFDKHNVAYFIYRDKLIVLSLGEELIAVKIKSPLIIESQRIIFEQLWKIARKV